MNRRPLVVGNWKMELSQRAATEVATSLGKVMRPHFSEVDIVVCPSFPALVPVSEILKSKRVIAVGAQNVHWEEKGAWTGEVSPLQLKGLATHCIVGHSERRQLTGETDEDVERKAAQLLRHDIMPIICIGETIEERQADRTIAKISAQAEMIFSRLQRSDMPRIAIAYEPIWAIGSGEMPEPRDVAEIALLLRKIVVNYFDQDAAERLRILYGGSVKPDNAGLYLNEPGIDGFLVGGASIHPLQFAEIITKVVEART